MSRRKQRGRTAATTPETPSTSADPPQRWPQPRPRPWLAALSTACVLAWLVFLLYLALAYGD